MEENINRRVLEEGSVEARTIEDAIAVLRYVAVSFQTLPPPRTGSFFRFSCNFEDQDTSLPLFSGEGLKWDGETPRGFVLDLPRPSAGTRSRCLRGGGL